MAIFAKDNFTDTNGTAITSHTPDIGGSWTNHASFGNNFATIQSNKFQGTGVGLTAYYCNATPGGADYTVAIDQTGGEQGSGTTNGQGPMGRIDTAAITGYWARYSPNNGGWQLFKSVAGTSTQLGATQTATLTASQVYHLVLSMVGTTISMIVDGTTLVSVTDSSISAAGKAGIRSAQLNTGTYLLDNFVATDTTSSGGPFPFFTRQAMSGGFREMAGGLI